MRAKAIGRRAGRAAIVLVATAVMGAGVAIAYADSSWEISPADPPGEGPAAVVETTPPVLEPTQPVVLRDSSWE